MTLNEATQLFRNSASLIGKLTVLIVFSRGDLDGELAVFSIVTAEHCRDVDGIEALDDR